MQRTITTASRISAFAWLALAFLACLAVLPINRAPLSYYDTAAYLAQGDAIVGAVRGQLRHLIPAGAPTVGGEATGASDGTVVGSRSATYAVFMTVMNAVFGIGSVVVAQTLLLMTTVWLCIRTASRACALGLDAPRIAGLAVLAGCLGSAPFLTAYLMPDIFAPILILLISGLALFAGAMRPWELVLAFLLGAAAVTAHPSHPLIAALMLGAAVVVALVLRPRRAWLGLLAAAGMIGVGLAERSLFTVTVQQVQKAEVIYMPFLTARFIVDGPGLDRLAELCPSDTLATCVLYDRVKDHPRRLTSSHIIFAKTEAEGSFALLDPEIQQRIAQEQGAFVADVVRHYPVGVAVAVANNAIQQLGMVSVLMSLPLAPTLERMGQITDDVPALLQQSRLTETPSWLPNVEAFHRTVYWISGGVIAVLLVLPWRGPPFALRAFAVLVIGGIVANALVCGGISQPAERYGARVIFLLPMLAVLLIAALPVWAPRTDAAAAGTRKAEAGHRPARPLT